MASFCYARPIKTVYLAGGMKTGWQDVVKTLLPGNIYLDPRDHHFTDELDYTAWDLTALRKADIVFGYMEKTNPHGAGLALEFGVAHALGIELHYVEDADFPHTKAFGMARAVADWHGADFESSLFFLAQSCGLELPSKDAIEEELKRYRLRVDALASLSL